MLSELFLKQSKGILFHVVAALLEKRLAAMAFIMIVITQGYHSWL